MPGEDDAGSSESPVRGAEASVDRHRGGGAFALGESTAERVGARGDRGQCAGTTSDHGKRPEEGQGGRGKVGAIRPSGSKNLKAAEASRRASASGSAGAAGSGGAGEDTDTNRELGAGYGENRSAIGCRRVRQKNLRS